MEKLAYLKIEDDFSPRYAADMLEEAKKQGFDEIILLHSGNASLRSNAYREKLLGVFRAAYRHKVRVYIADDRSEYSGTAFGELIKVKDMQLRYLAKIKTAEAAGEKILAERGDECIVAKYFSDDEPCADLTNPYAAGMVIDSVYAPLCREYEKFAGYEFKGFACLCPLLNPTDKVIYSEAVCSETENLDYFKLMEKGGEYEKYISSAQRAMEEGYILPLKRFCQKKGLDFVLCGGKNSARSSFVKENSKYNLSYDFTGDYLMGAGSIKKAVLSGIAGAAPVVPVSLVMKRMEKRGDFIKSLPAHCPKVPLESIENAPDAFLITNLTDRQKQLCLLLEDYVITDPDNGELYPLLKTEYIFYPYSYLFVQKKTDDMYIEALPARVGGVLAGEFDEEGEIAFEKRGDVYAFSMPDTDLSCKHIEFIGDFEFLKVRLGSMEHELVQQPFTAPLYGFLREARGGAAAIGGEIEKIVIKKPLN